MNLGTIQKAMEELRVAKEEIARLQQSRVEAEKNVKKALDLVDSVKDKTESTSNYSDETYWENRYKESKEPKKDVYEWYVSFDHIGSTIEEDVGKLSSGAKSLILVSGCGNSTLCEDFVNKGFSTVHGMDYSPSVIKSMQERSKDLNLASIKYFQADARYMPDVPSGHYDVLFDKGTLDAISSSGNDNTQTTQNDSIDALNYICEMWRVLRVGGLFILISTMPPDILESLALTPLLQARPSTVLSKSKTTGDNSGASDWQNGCRVLPLTTQEGGSVYYYALTKFAEIDRRTSYRPGQTTKQTSTNKTTTNTTNTATATTGSGGHLKTTDTSGIMAGIAALLEEAKRAKETMEAATQQQQKAAAEVRDVELKRASLEKTLQSGLQDMNSKTTTTTSNSKNGTTDRSANAEQEEEEEMNSFRGSSGGGDGNDGGKKSGFSEEIEEDSAEKRHNEAIIQKAIEAAVRKVAPVVKVFLDQQTSSALVAEGTVEVYYLLHRTKPVPIAAKGGTGKVNGMNYSNSDNDRSGWSEDDTVSLVCRASPAATSITNTMSDAQCYKEDEQPYEAFEYTNPPRVLSPVALLPPSDLTLLQNIGALDYIHKLSKTKLAVGLEHQFSLGQVSVKLPSFGGVFHLSYVRTLTLPATAVTLYDVNSPDNSNTRSGKVVQRRVVLAQSVPVAPRVPLYGAHPDARGASVSRLFPEPTVNSVVDKSVNTVRRRGAGVIINASVSTVPAFLAELTMWVEDLSHIQTLNVVTALRDRNAQRSLLARTMAWVEPSLHTPHTLQLIVEADVITPADDNNNSGDARVRTVYAVLQLTDDLFNRASLDLRAAYGHVDADGKFVCRLPYTLHSKSQMRKTSKGRGPAPGVTASGYDPLKPFADLAVTLAKRQSGVDSNCNINHNSLNEDEKDVSITAQCGFCRAEVLNSESIQSLRPLPTGLLDNMMHDFICCEELPQSGLTSTDVETPQHTLLYGPLYASVHPKHVRAGAVQLQCKIHSTVLDVFTGCGGALATAPIPLGPKSGAFSGVGKVSAGSGAGLSEEQRRTKILQAFKTVINIDTCSILCARCTNYLGDAHLQGESCDRNCGAVHTMPSTTSTAGNAATTTGSTADAEPETQATKQQDFAIADLRDVRFALHAITFSIAAARAQNIRTQTEQFVARCVLHINTTYNLSSFCLYAADSDFGKSKQATVGVILKLVSPDYRISQPVTSVPPTAQTAALSITLMDCMKVSYSVGPVVDILLGNEARLPLEYSDLRQVIALLQARSVTMGPSPFKGQFLSYLRK